MITDEFIDFGVWNSSFGITLRACGHEISSNEKLFAKQKVITITVVESDINFLPVNAVHGLFSIILIIITIV